MPRSNSHGKTVTYSKHLSSGEPDDAKVSSPVRRGVCGKVSVRITRHIPTLLHLVAGTAPGLALGAGQTRQGHLYGVSGHARGAGTFPDGPQDARRPATVRG